MEKKIYETYLKELFGPNPSKIYVRYYNIWADDINQGLRLCEGKFGGREKATVAQNHFCYWSARLAATPKFVNSLRQAASSECKGNEKCSKKLMAFAEAHKNEIPYVKKEVVNAKAVMSKERTGGKVKVNVRKKTKQAKKY